MISKSFLRIVFSISILSLSHETLAFREVRNGGGGVHMDGRYLTFQSAKIPVTATPEKPMSIPGLKYLVEKITDLPIDDTMRGNLILNIWATSSRKYFKVSHETVDSAERARIIAEYSKLMNIPANNVALFAITSPEANATLLLPEFYQLTTREQAAILLHESMWIWKPDSSYQSVVAVEQAAQAYFEKQTSETFYNFVYQIGEITRSPRFVLAAALAFDLQKNRMGPIAITKRRIPLKYLIGAKFIKGLLTRVDIPLKKTNLPEFAASAISATTNNTLAYPENTFYLALLDFLQQGGFIGLSGYIPLEETDLIASGNQLLKNKIFKSDGELSDYMNELYMDLTLPSHVEPLRYRLVTYDGQVLGSVVFY